MIRQILRLVSKKHYEEARKESLQWKLTCGTCGYRTNVWDAGGIRYGAKGWKSKIVKRCPECKRKRLFNVHK